LGINLNKESSKSEKVTKHKDNMVIMLGVS